jgi:uncharacterized coiled-coil protein SlyX
MSFILPLTAAILLVVCGIAFALWEKNKTANYTILGLSAAAFGFFFYMGFLWPSNFTEIRVMGINNNCFIGLGASSILLFSSAAIIHNQSKPETDQPEQEQQPTQPTEKTEKKPVVPVHTEQKGEASGKLSQTMLKGLATLEVTIHFDEEQIDQIATIVTERQEQLQKSQINTNIQALAETAPTNAVPSSAEPSAETVQPETETQKAAPEKSSEVSTSEEPSPVPLIRHVKPF